MALLRKGDISTPYFIFQPVSPLVCQMTEYQILVVAKYGVHDKDMPSTMESMESLLPR